MRLVQDLFLGHQPVELDLPPATAELSVLWIIKMEADGCECVKTSEFILRSYLKKMFQACKLVCVCVRVRTRKHVFRACTLSDGLLSQNHLAPITLRDLEW